MLPPLTSPAQTFFRPADQEPRRPRLPTVIIEGDRNTCRWCLEKFDVEKQERSIAERGYLRTNLMMADNGSDLVCCDQCFQGAIGARVLIHGRIVPGDPSAIDNPLLARM